MMKKCVQEIRELLEFYDVEDVAMITGIDIAIVKMVYSKME